jgi:hypothetical protein
MDKLKIKVAHDYVTRTLKLTSERLPSWGDYKELIRAKNEADLGMYNPKFVMPLEYEYVFHRLKERNHKETLSIMNIKEDPFTDGDPLSRPSVLSAKDKKPFWKVW